MSAQKGRIIGLMDVFFQGKRSLKFLFTLAVAFFVVASPGVASADTLQVYCTRFNDAWFTNMSFGYGFCFPGTYADMPITTSEATFGASLSIGLIGEGESIEKMDEQFRTDTVGSNIPFGANRDVGDRHEEFNAVPLGSFATRRSINSWEPVWDNTGKEIGHRQNVSITYIIRLGRCYATLGVHGEGPLNSTLYYGTLSEKASGEAGHVTETMVAAIGMCGGTAQRSDAFPVGSFTSSSLDSIEAPVNAPTKSVPASAPAVPPVQPAPSQSVAPAQLPRPTKEEVEQFVRDLGEYSPPDESGFVFVDSGNAEAAQLIEKWFPPIDFSSEPYKTLVERMEKEMPMTNMPVVRGMSGETFNVVLVGDASFYPLNKPTTTTPETQKVVVFPDNTKMFAGVDAEFELSGSASTSDFFIKLKKGTVEILRGENTASSLTVETPSGSVTSKKTRFWVAYSSGYAIAGIREGEILVTHALTGETATLEPQENGQPNVALLVTLENVVASSGYDGAKTLFFWIPWFLISFFVLRTFYANYKATYVRALRLTALGINVLVLALFFFPWLPESGTTGWQILTEWNLGVIGMFILLLAAASTFLASRPIVIKTGAVLQIIAGISFIAVMAGLLPGTTTLTLLYIAPIIASLLLLVNIVVVLLLWHQLQL